jgi:transposase
VAQGGTQAQAIGRSRGGLTTKIVALADALGNLVRFVLLPGQRHDTVGVPPLIEGMAFGALLGDKAFDVDWLRADLDARGAAAVIPPKANRKAQINLDRDMYRWRHLIENTFAKLKEFRAVATRYDKTDTSYVASIHLAAAVIASRCRQQALDGPDPDMDSPGAPLSGPGE